MPDLELGNIMFNTNKNQSYECPQYIIALLRDINRVLNRMMWNNTQKEYDSPFENTGNTFKCSVFEVQAYSWDDSIEQEYNFKFNDIKISWYKYLGRDTTINKQITPERAIEMYDKCIKKLNKMDKYY